MQEKITGESAALIEVPMLRTKKTASTKMHIPLHLVLVVLGMAGSGTWAVVAYTNTTAEKESTVRAGAVEKRLSDHMITQEGQFDDVHLLLKNNHESILQLLSGLKDDTSEIKTTVDSNCQRLTEIEKHQALHSTDLEECKESLRAPISTVSSVTSPPLP